MALAKLVLPPVNLPTDQPVTTSPTPINEQPTPATPHPTPADHAPPVDEQPVTVPAHLIPAARFAIVNHQQHTGRPITAEQLAERLDITPAVASRLLHTIDPPAVPAHVNGARVLEGAQR